MEVNPGLGKPPARAIESVTGKRHRHREPRQRYPLSQAVMS